MLQSTLLSYPGLKVGRSSSGVFGVLLADKRWIKLSLSGSWSAAELRHFCALFEAWSQVDPQGMFPPTKRNGVLRMEEEVSRS